MAPAFDLTLNLAYMYEFQKQKKQTNKQTNKKQKKT